MFHFTCKYSNHLQVFVKKGIGESEGREGEQVSSFSTRKFNSLQPIELKCASALELTWIKRIQQSSYEFITQERRVLDLLRLSLYLFCTVQFYFMSTDNAAELSSLCAWCGALPADSGAPIPLPSLPYVFVLSPVSQFQAECGICKSRVNTNKFVYAMYIYMYIVFHSDMINSKVMQQGQAQTCSLLW